jgi:outer membrane protein assembly factor BamB
MKYLLSTAVVLSVLGAGLFVLGRRHGAGEIVAPAGSADDAPKGEGPLAGGWPCWRGPHADGRSADATPPLHWSDSRGIVWKAAVPGRGHASPVVWKDHVVLATADEEAGVQSLACYDRANGSLQWQTALHRGGLMARHAKNSHASATPACDGRHAYVPFVHDDGLWLSAVREDGAIAWQTRVGPFVSEWGYGSSPALFGGLVIVAGENKGSKLGHWTGLSSYLAAVRGDTGEVVWRVRRPRGFSYGTPVVAAVAGRPQVLLAGNEAVTAHDPATGRELWQCRWPAARTAGTMAFGPDVVFASTTLPRPELLAIRADGSGDVSDSHVVWRLGRGAADVPSPLFHEGRLYVVTDSGQALCLDTATGEVTWQQRLAGPFSASPVLAAGRIYVTNEAGTTWVFRAGPRFELLARNALSDEVLASPAVVGSQLFLRGRQTLYCLGEGQAQETTARR